MPPKQIIALIAITPFIEFIDSLDSTYWLSSELARVLSPGELHPSGSPGRKFSSSRERVAEHRFCL